MSLLLFSYYCARPHCAVAQSSNENDSKPVISIPENLDKAVKQEAATVKKQIAQQTQDLFERKPLDFDLSTLYKIWNWMLRLLTRPPQFFRDIIKETQLLGIVGSLIVLGFLGALLYSFVGARKVLERLETLIDPMKGRIPEIYYPYFVSVLKILAASIIPLLVLGLYSLVHQLIMYEASWFLLLGSFLKLWFLGAVILTFLHEALLPAHLPIPANHAKAIYKVSRKVVIYALLTVGSLWGAEAFEVPNDVIALLKFVVYLSLVIVSLFLLLKKKSIIAVLPKLPYRIYQLFYSAAKRLYYPAIVITFITGVIWCFGYRALTEFIWVRTWAVAAVFFAIVVTYHNFNGLLTRWFEKKDPRDEVARAFYHSLHALLVFITITAAVIIILNLLGLLNIIQAIISFPLLVIGDTPVSLWILAKATIIFVGFVFISRLLRAYLDYKVYPSIGVDEGLAYSINTLIGYVLIAIGLAAALRAVGLDFKVLMVFAGAVGIGIGLGLQSLAGKRHQRFYPDIRPKGQKGRLDSSSGSVGICARSQLASDESENSRQYRIPNPQLGTYIHHNSQSYSHGT